ncbi:MAG: HPr(Ser) kinase/phosphatase [Gemmatimonadota bacterium]|jgi:HPr kinase/phosphorylase|nr:HPr(Ser) kinase/phosphatase [Gemmatimonadota bacterium]
MLREPLTIEQLLERKKETLALELLTGDVGLSRVLARADISSPGLVLTGFVDRFPADRIQVLGETEVAFLHSLDEDRRRAALELFLSFEIPVIFITKGQDAPAPLTELARERSVPVIRSALKTADFFSRIKLFLEDYFAPVTTIHGSLADVYGVGLLFTGSSGIGKSEAVLDLVERGHRLVADDLVIASRRGTGILIGHGHELQRHHMEIRGVGIIDIAGLFGIRAIRQQKRIEVIVHLEAWNENATYDRTGLDKQEVEILGVPIPRVVVPLNPGKNITVITEVVALTHLQKYAGIDSAARFNERLRQRLAGSATLEEDYE